jgi:probable phosphoglycerate mutase
MTWLAFIRHAPTAWNGQRRLQGRRDLPITAASAAMLATRRVPSPFRSWRCVASPLLRCRETAAALGLDPAIEPRLIEADWGVYEGATIEELRRREGETFQANERRGLDFLPPEGESPRMVQRRVMPWLAEIAAAATPILAVSHRGVMRAIYALARSWDMTGDPPDHLDHYAMHLFSLDPHGMPRVEQLNIQLEPR